MKTTWRLELSFELEKNNESWEDVESTTLSEEDMDKEFSSGYGVLGGCAFTLWTKNKVYFPICYDGSEWAGSAARNPDGGVTKHQGNTEAYI